MIDDWPLRIRLWWHAHNVVNRLAWRFARSTAGRGDREASWLWRLNDRLAARWTEWYVAQVVADEERRLRERERW